MRNVFASLSNRADTLKGRLVLGVAGILCALMLAPVIGPILTPSTQGAALRMFYQEESADCSSMYGCSSDMMGCKDNCLVRNLLGLTVYSYPCCYGGSSEEEACLYCE